MSAFHTGGRTKHQTPVILNVYDLDPASQANQLILNSCGVGFHHSGVEVSGTEYTFAGGAGVFEDQPKSAGGAVFSHSVIVGVFEGTSTELRKAVDSLRDDFRGDRYHLLLRNCNHFADELCWALIRTRIPGYVNRIADYGSYFSCLLPENMLTGDPTQGGGGSGGGGGGYSVYGGGSRAAISSSSSFSGAGHSMSASSASSGGGGGGGGGEEGENVPLLRREKARQAAIDRMDANNK
jgi:hypothetical protein